MAGQTTGDSPMCGVDLGGWTLQKNRSFHVPGMYFNQKHGLIDPPFPSCNMTGNKELTAGTVHGKEHMHSTLSPESTSLLPNVERAPTRAVTPHACAAFSSHDLCHFSNDALVSANLFAASLFVESIKASLLTIPGALLTYWLSVQSHLGSVSRVSPALVCFDGSFASNPPWCLVPVPGGVRVRVCGKGLEAHGSGKSTLRF